MHGAINERSGWLEHRLALNGKLKMTPTGFLKYSSMYNVSYPFPDNDVLVQVEAIPEQMPHLMTWAPVAVPREGKLSLLFVARRLQKYFVNMLDEEVALIAPRIHYLSTFQEINDIEMYDDTAIIHCHVDGKPYSCVITVMNMIDLDVDYHWHRRDSLN